MKATMLFALVGSLMAVVMGGAARADQFSFDFNGAIPGTYAILPVTVTGNTTPATLTAIFMPDATAPNGAPTLPGILKVVSNSGSAFGDPPISGNLVSYESDPPGPYALTVCTNFTAPIRSISLNYSTFPDNGNSGFGGPTQPFFITANGISVPFNPSSTSGAGYSQGFASMTFATPTDEVIFSVTDNNTNATARLFIDNMVVESTGVPEPSSLALFAIGILGMGSNLFLRRRKRNGATA